MKRHEPSRDPLAETARQLFDRRSGHLDANAVLRLRQARREALSSGARPVRRHWLPLGMASAATLLIALAWWTPQRGGQTLPSGADSTLSANIESAALANDEDSELYAWLGDAPVAPDEDKAGSL